MTLSIILLCVFPAVAAYLMFGDLVNFVVYKIFLWLRGCSGFGEMRKKKSTKEIRKYSRPAHYPGKTNKIKDGIEEKFNRLLLAWCHTDVVGPDFIVSTLAKYDIDVEIRDKWTGLPILSAKLFHSGVIAEFRSERRAVAAAKELSMLSRSVMTFQLSRILDIFIDAELGHPMCGTVRTRILVKGMRYLGGFTERIHTTTLLRSLGKIRGIRFPSEAEYLENEVVCEVTYSYASHAYAAKLYMDGLSFRPVVRYTVEVLETLYEKEILQKVKSRMIDLMDENRLVPLRI